MMKLSLIIIAFTTALGCHAQTESLLSYGEMALGRKADGSNLMMHVVPTYGKANYFKISEKMPYVLIGNEKGIKMYNTESGEYITDVKRGSKNLAQVCPDGYLTYSEGGLFFLSFGSPTFYN